jgi:hypothetical protein
VPVAVPEGRAVRPASVRVVLEGPASLLRTLQPEDVRPGVDAGLEPGKEAPVKVELSPGHAGLRVKEVTPASVSVRPARPPRRTR